MKGRRFLTAFSALLLVLAVFFGAVGTGLAQEEGDQPAQTTQSAGVDLGSGNQGVFIPSGLTSGVTVENLNQREVGWVRGKMQGRAVQLEAPSGSTQRAYVFFKLNGHLRRAWNDGELKIVYRPHNSQNWQDCPTFAVGLAGGEGNNGPQGPARLACLTNTYNAVYALVRGEGFRNQTIVTAQ